MGKHADKLNYLIETKEQIKNFLRSKGVTVSDDDTFRSYVEKMQNLSPETQEVTITPKIEKQVINVGKKITDTAEIILTGSVGLYDGILKLNGDGTATFTTTIINEEVIEDLVYWVDVDSRFVAFDGGTYFAPFSGTCDITSNYDLIYHVNHEIDTHFINQNDTALISKVTVEAVDSTIDSNITPENIKEGVTILNVTGTHAGGSAEDRFVLYLQKKLTEVKAEDFGDTVYSVSMYQFYNNTGIIKVTLPESVTSIQNYAFKGCTNLKEINLHDKITSIFTEAFQGCGLEELIFPAKVTTINSNVYYGCNKAKKLTIHENITSLNSKAFYNCTALTEINYNATQMNTTTSGSSTNYFNYAGTEGEGITVNIGANVKSIPDYLFSAYENSSRYPKIIRINFAENSECTKIGASAFSYLAEITNCILPDSITTIGASAFSGCTALSNIELPSSITSIGNNAFQNCVAFTSFTIPETITTLSDRILYYCSGLKTITIPEHVTSVGNAICSNCTGLTTAYVRITESTTKITSSSYGWFNNCSSSLKIHAPSSLNSTTSKTAFGQYWNYRTSSAAHTVYYDL